MAETDFRGEARAECGGCVVFFLFPSHLNAVMVLSAQGLEEYCTLIDSSSSFRAYRAALADVEPPCIPYL